MGKTITAPYFEPEEKKYFKERVIQEATVLLGKHGIHNGLGIPQERVSWLRRKKELDIKNALWVLYNAGKLHME